MKFAIASLVLALCVGQIFSSHLCGFGDGKDICSPGGEKCTPLVVRPRELPKLRIEDILKPRVVCKQIPGLPPLKPIGDLCSCRQSIVKPAIVPKPACPTCSAPPASCSCRVPGSITVQTNHKLQQQIQNHHQQESIISVAPGSYPEVGYVYEEAFKAPADPVSLSLAYKQQNVDCGLNEGKLSYGFSKLPVDGCVTKTCKKFPEENLFRLNGKVVELKPVSCKQPQLSIDDEALEDLAAAEFEESLNGEEQVSNAYKHLTYGDLGFVPAKYKKVPMAVDCSGADVGSSAHTDLYVPCNDGFVPGDVQIRNIPRKEVYVQAPKVPVDCGEVYETFPVAKPIKYVSSSSYASSACSDNARHHQAVYTVGC